MKNPKQLDGSRVLLHVGVSLLILFRTLPYLLHGHENIITDESSFGLMAKHLAEGRELPILFYGQKYPFVLSSWIAAPLFWAFGSSAAMLRLPLLFWNLITGNLLAHLLRKECGLTARWAFICCLWFLLPSVMSSNDWMDVSKMSETFLFVLLLWTLRRRPLISGLITGVGLMQRPFVLYGLVALMFLEWREAGLKKAAVLKLQARRVFGIAVTYSLIRALAVFGTNYSGNPAPIHLKRFRFMLEDTRGFFAEILTRTIGLKVQKIPYPPIGMMESHFNALGLATSFLGLALVAILLQQIWKLRHLLWQRTRDERTRFAFFLSLTGIISVGAYVVLSPPDPHIHYVQLLIFGLIGIYALQNLLGTDLRLKILSLVFLFGCMTNNLISNARAWADLAQLERVHPTANLIEYLKQHGIRAGVGEFGSNHNITFETGEQIIIAEAFPAGRFPQQTSIIANTPEQNRARITLQPCPGGVPVEVWYVCPF